MTSDCIEKDPFRKTPWLGRLLLAVIEKVIAVVFAVAFRNAVLPDAANSAAFALAVCSTILAIIFVGRVGTMVPGRKRLCSMIVLTYIFALMNRLLPKMWQASYLSVEVLSFGCMIGLALLQVPNIFRAIEMRRGEDEAYRKRHLDDPARFHRCGM